MVPTNSFSHDALKQECISS